MKCSWQIKIQLNHCKRIAELLLNFCILTPGSICFQFTPTGFTLANSALLDLSYQKPRVQISLFRNYHCFQKISLLRNTSMNGVHWMWKRWISLTGNGPNDLSWQEKLKWLGSSNQQLPSFNLQREMHMGQRTFTEWLEREIWLMHIFDQWYAKTPPTKTSCEYKTGIKSKWMSLNRENWPKKYHDPTNHMENDTETK